ncbi:MAG TPA: ATP-binding protein [Patescibacteria group bacterium]|nr:ATP-binding protein [Patescibacteria group bacterium]
MENISAEWLQNIPALKDVPLEQLRWFAANSRHYVLEAGEHLFKTGEPIAGTHIIVSGRLRITMLQNNSLREVGVIEAREITGHLPFSRGKVAFGMGTAIEKTQVMTFPTERVHDLIVHNYELTEALVHVMSNRVRDTTALQQQNEKMMALGKLSAGLAHELNNPAAAIVRSSASLKKHLRHTPETFKTVMSIKISPEEVDAVNERMTAVLLKTDHPTLNLMERTDKEDEMYDCLDEMGVDNAQEIAENFVDFGFSCDDIEFFKTHIPQTHMSPVLNWINNNLVTEKMVNDIHDASERISTLVNSVKNFTHMDRAGDMQKTDIHSGIMNTLNMLNYKIKKGNIEVIEKFDRTLPEVNAMVGELNQVWTNLIDNAIDAMEPQGKGTLEIITQKDGDFVRVLIIDSGAGMTPEVMSRIFDPFYTTKEMGKGTGLGLDVVQRIVKQHNGAVRAKSQPGRTEFEVCFPIDG